jgi:hypothetical protein
LVGRVRNLLRTAGPAGKYYSGTELDDDILANREICIRRARIIIAAHPIELFIILNLKLAMIYLWIHY